MADRIAIKGFWTAAAIRALRTFAQGMIGAIGTSAVGVTQVDWLGAASIGLTAAIISILMALAGLPEVDDGRDEEEAEE